MNKTNFYCVIVVLALFFTYSVHAQSVDEFQKRFSGNTCFSNGTMTISSSGYLKMPNKAQRYFIWDVPTNVSKIVIKSNTIVNAAFHFNHALSIEGENRATSIMYGTQIKAWDANNGTVNISDIYKYCSVQKGENGGGTGSTTVSNITFLNPKGYAIRGLNSGGSFEIKNCNFIDVRGGAQNHSDGIEVPSNGLVDNCYFSTGDDNIKMYKPGMKVTNCTFNMIENSVPFQFGWGPYTNNATMTASNIRIQGSSGRNGTGNYPVIEGGSWNQGGSSFSDISFSDISITNSNASLITIRNSGQSAKVRMTNANIQVNKMWGTNNNTGAPGRIDFVSCGGAQDVITSCSTVIRDGSSVDSYTVPDFATTFINSNSGGHSGVVGSVADVNRTVSNGCTGGGTTGGGSTSCLNSPNGKVSFTKTDATCTRGGSVTFKVSNYGGRTQIRYKVGNNLFSGNQSTLVSYTVNNISAGTYDVYAEWGNGDCSNTKVGTVTIGNSCNAGGNGNVLNGTYYLKARHSNKFIEVVGSSTLNGANVQQWQDQIGNNKKWIITNVSGEWYKIINVNSNKALDLTNYSTSNGGNIQQWTYAGTDNQLWKFVNKGSGWYQMVSKSSGKAVNIASASTSNGANVYQWTASDVFSQQFQLISANSASVSTSTTDKMESTERFGIYPNPVNDILNIKGIDDNGTYQILSIDGKLVGSGRGNRVEVSTLSKGLYFIRVNSETLKFIKE